MLLLLLLLVMIAELKLWFHSACTKGSHHSSSRRPHSELQSVKLLLNIMSACKGPRAVR
jgi:hypothetical protein